MLDLSGQKETNNKQLTPEEIESWASESQSPFPMKQQERLAAWVQFPRRIVLLLIAFVVASGLIGGLRELLPLDPWAVLSLGKLDKERIWAESWALEPGRSVAELVGERLPNTLLLLGAALFLALLLALVVVLVAVLVHELEQKVGPLGSILKGLGRLWVFSSAATPVFCMGLFLILIFAVRLKLLPAGGMFSPGETGGLSDRIAHLILPTLTLALLPAALTAQVAAREVTLPRGHASTRVWLTGLFKAMGTLLGQIGGLLGAAVLVETVFSWPGIGILPVKAAYVRDLPVLFGVLSAYVVLILIGRLAAELFRWLGRLVRVPVLSPQPEPTPWRRTARRIWVVLALVILLAPLGLAFAGLAVDQDAALRVDLGVRLAPPSAGHPWGTDRMGRDLQARVLRGGLITLETVAFMAAVTLVLSGLGGALTGFLASRRALWAESVADLLLLPADALLFIPAVPGAIVITTLLPRTANSPGVIWGLTAALVLLPRAVRVYQTLWTAAPERRKGLVLGLFGLGVLLLGSLFAGLWLVTALEFLGFGTPPPLPTLGGVMGEGFHNLAISPQRVLAPGIVLWVCAFAFYIAADALVGFFHSKEALARLNE